MALGSCRPTASASSNHLRNCSIGSGVASASRRPARVYSLRRSATERSTRLPAPGAGATLERTDDVGSDPTAVEVPLLRLNLLPVHPARIHRRRIEGHVVLETGVGGNRVRVEPGGPALPSLVGLDVVVACHALPLAERGPLRERQVLHPDVLGGDIVDGWVARLENPLGTRRVRKRHPPEDDLYASVRVLLSRRTRVVPYGLLPWAGFYALATQL